MAKQWYDTFKAATSGGILPNTKIAAKMRYRHAINWEVDLFSFGIGSKTGEGSWNVKFVAPGGATIFEQKVTIRLFLVNLSVPGLNLFTWNFSKETIETSNVGGNAVTTETIGDYVQGGTAQSEQGDMQPASGEGATDLTATIISDWLSPIYLFRVPVGTKVVVTRDTWGFGPATVEYGWAFEDGSDNLLDTTLDSFDALLSARGANGAPYIHTARSWPGYRFLDAGGFVEGTEPTILEMPDGTEILAVLTDEGYVEHFSLNSEWNWKRVKYPDLEAGFGRKSQAIFPTGITMPKTVAFDDLRIALAERGGRLITRVVGVDGLGETLDVGPVVDGKSYSIERERGGAILIVDNSGLPVYRSRSVPLNWAPVPPAVTS